VLEEYDRLLNRYVIVRVLDHPSDDSARFELQ
jgi:hypothetical protein